MNENNILQRLSPLVRSVFGNSELEINDSMNAGNTDGWTSLNFMRLLEAVEKEFGFKFKMMELLGINTMGDLIGAIEKHINTNG